MKHYKLIPIDDKETWNKLLSKFDNQHFLQSWQWGEIKGTNGWKASRFLVKSNDGDIAVFQLLTKRIHPRIPFTMGYVPKGPAFNSGNIDINKLLSLIELAGRNRGCTFVKVDPDVDETTEQGRKWKKTLETSGWQYSSQQLQPKNTGITQLLPDNPAGEEELLSNMKQRGRRGIRKASKAGVTVRIGNAKDIPGFFKLYKLTGARQGFGVRNLEYYREIFRVFNDNDAFTEAVILISEHPDEEEPLGSAMFIRFDKKVWYFYGASSNRRRSDMSPYLLQWDAMRWARSTGATVYDWHGAATDPDDPNDGMARVWHFKKGFGAELFNGVGAWDKPLNAPQWLLVLLLSKIQKLFKR